MSHESSPLPYNPELVEVDGDVRSLEDFSEPTNEVSIESREESLSAQAEQDYENQSQEVKDALDHARLVAEEGAIYCANCNTPSCRGCGRS
jgi:hypothetical protein